MPDWIDGMQFPQSVTIPAAYIHLVGSREISILSANDQLPAVVLNWMKNDLRYRTWFEG